MIPLLYIDPGTGSMLFSIFIGIATVITFGIQSLLVKIKFFFSGGKTDKLAIASRVPFVIFSDHKRYVNVFKPLCDEFERRAVDVVYYTASPDDPILEAGYKHIHAQYLGSGNKPYAKLNMLHADILIATTPNLDVYQWKRSRFVTCYVHVPHVPDEMSTYRMFALDYYDVVLTSGQHQNEFIKEIEQLRPNIARKELVTVGSLFLDDLAQKYQAQHKIKENNPPVVLVAPSWGPSGILSRYGERFLSALNKTSFKIIVRPHPQTIVSEQDILQPLTGKFSQFEWNYDNSNFAALDKADVLISDFSGILFDFALVFDKPLFYADTHFDTSMYDADWLSKPRWACQVLPKIGKELNESDFDHLEAIIGDVLGSKAMQESRQAIRAECWEHIGVSAVNSVNYLVQKQKQL